MNYTLSYLEELDSFDLIEIWNTYNECLKDYGRIIHMNDNEFFERYFNNSPMALARAISYGNYYFGDSYLILNDRHTIESFSSSELNKYIDMNELLIFLNSEESNEEGFYGI